MGVDADPADIAKEAVEKAKREGFDTVVVDTAGRQVVDEELMEELRRVKKTGRLLTIWYFICIIITAYLNSFPCNIVYYNL
jgi:signal recognition particle GTPase